MYGSSAGAINATYFLSGQREGVNIYTDEIACKEFIDLGRLLNFSGKPQGEHIHRAWPPKLTLTTLPDCAWTGPAQTLINLYALVTSLPAAPSYAPAESETARDPRAVLGEATACAVLSQERLPCSPSTGPGLSAEHYQGEAPSGLGCGAELGSAPESGGILPRHPAARHPGRLC